MSAKLQQVRRVCGQCRIEYLTVPYQHKVYCSLACQRIGAAKHLRTGKREESARWKGGAVTRLDGYVAVYAGDQRYEPEHIKIAQAALGRPLPPGAEVHHVDKNRGNNAPTNLVICQNRAYHHLLHARQRVVDAGGHPEIQKLCSQCRLVKGKAEFYMSRAEWDGRSTACRECCKKRDRLRSSQAAA